MRTLKPGLLILLLSAVPLHSAAQQPMPLPQLADKIAEQERAEIQLLQRYSPIVETYIQTVRPDGELGAVPDGDQYFLGRARLTHGIHLDPLLSDTGHKHNLVGDVRKFFSPQFLPAGFLQMIFVDASGLDRQHYAFHYVRREFLGDVRCLLFDVAPLPRSGKGRFTGRIWVEDQDYHIVRFNGVYGGSSKTSFYFNFDSWRVNTAPGIWLPAFIYTAEGDVHSGAIKRTAPFGAFKAQTRLWGYNPAGSFDEQQLNKVLVESATPIRDQSDSSEFYSPVQAMRSWDMQGEDNILAKLEQLGLIAPYGDVDKMLETVVNNLEVTNNLDIDPEVRCRVLMTSTFESFTVGHTIVLSRGLIDVLPGEPSLAAILAHELGHVVLGYRLDSRFSFFGNLSFGEKESFRHFGFARTPQEEQAADQKADELLKNSPYKDQLGSARAFLQSLQRRQKEIPNLISPHLGDQVLTTWTLASVSGSLVGGTASSIPALPLGTRISVDPWNDQLHILKSKPVGAIASYERMPFEVTPFFIYLTRQLAAPASAPSSASSSLAPEANNAPIKP